MVTRLLLALASSLPFVVPAAALAQAYSSVAPDEIEHGIYGGWAPVDAGGGPILWISVHGRIDIVAVDGTRLEHRREAFREELREAAFREELRQDQPEDGDAFVIGDGPAARRWPIVERTPERLVLRLEPGRSVAYRRPVPPASIEGIWAERTPADGEFRILRFHGNGRVAIFATGDEKSGTSIGRYTRQHHVVALSESMPREFEELIVLARTDTDLVLASLRGEEVWRFRRIEAPR